MSVSCTRDFTVFFSGCAAIFVSLCSLSAVTWPVIGWPAHSHMAFSGGTDVSGLMRGLATLPPRCIQEWPETGMEDLACLCCKCS